MPKYLTKLDPTMSGKRVKFLLDEQPQIGELYYDETEESYLLFITILELDNCYIPDKLQDPENEYKFNPKLKMPWTSCECLFQVKYDDSLSEELKRLDITCMELDGNGPTVLLGTGSQFLTIKQTEQ